MIINHTYRIVFYAYSTSYYCSNCELYYKHFTVVTLALARSIFYYLRGVIYDHKSMLQIAAYLYNRNNVYSTGHK